MSTRAITLVAAAIIHDQDKFLICQRLPTGTFPSYWEFPGGKVEFGETPTDALSRELAEELDITVQIEQIYDVASVICDQTHLVLLFYRCTTPDGVPQAIQCQDLRWVTVDELDKYQFPPADEQVLAKLKKAKG